MRLHLVNLGEWLFSERTSSSCWVLQIKINAYWNWWEGCSHSISQTFSYLRVCQMICKRWTSSLGDQLLLVCQPIAVVLCHPMERSRLNKQDTKCSKCFQKAGGQKLAHLHRKKKWIRRFWTKGHTFLVCCRKKLPVWCTFLDLNFCKTKPISTQILQLHTN